MIVSAPKGKRGFPGNPKDHASANRTSRVTARRVFVSEMMIYYTVQGAVLYILWTVFSSVYIYVHFLLEQVRQV